MSLEEKSEDKEYLIDYAKSIFDEINRLVDEYKNATIFSEEDQNILELYETTYGWGMRRDLKQEIDCLISTLILHIQQYEFSYNVKIIIPSELFDFSDCIESVRAVIPLETKISDMEAVD